MAYIIAGANLSNREAPTIAVRAETAKAALAEVTRAEANGYHVRISNSEGQEISVSDSRGLAGAEGELGAQDDAPDPLSGSF
jgi:hypothetical protein